MSDCCPARNAPGSLPAEPGAPSLARAARFKLPLVTIDKTEFLIGSDSRDSYRSDGEGPQRRVSCDAFQIAPYAVSNR